MARTGREVHLAARPAGEPRQEDFRVVEVDVPEPRDGEVLVRNLLMSVDPYMRGRMNDRKSYMQPFEIDQPLNGGAVGEVVASRAEGIEEGDVVLHDRGWREYAVVDARHARVVDPDAAPLAAFLGALGMTGLTAYAGLLDIAQLREGDIVFVSAAAGAVGSMAAQIAKVLGHVVIGSAGSPEKVRYLLDELGLDAAFDYHDGPVAELLRAAAPEGIDVYFDNVGGEHLEAAVDSLHVHGRVAMCGSISGYNAPEPPPGPRNLALCVGKRLTLRGFLVRDHADRMADFVRDVGRWLREGRLKAPVTIVEGGIEQAPRAFIDLLRGANTGKMLVEL